MQRFSQSTNEYKDTEFVDDDGYPVFRTVTTPKRFGPKDTAIERATTDTESKTAAWAPVAAIEYHEWRPTRFRFQGRDVEFNKYMEKKGWWGGKWRFIAESGRAYSWSTNSTPFRLTFDDKREVGSYHHRSLGILNEKHPAYLELHADAVGNLEEILMTLVYLLYREEQQNTASASAAAGASASASAASAAAAAAC